MSRTIELSVLVLLCTALAGPGAGARAAGPSQATLVMESFRRVRDYQADGTWTEDTTAAVRVLQEPALKRMAVLVFRYVSGAEHLDFEYVRVRKPDGTLVVTPAESIQDLSAEVTRQAPVYSDLREKHVAVKGLALGDTLEYRLKDTATKVDIPGHYWLGFDFQRAEVVRQAVIQVSFPAGRAVKVVSPGGTRPEDRSEGGRRTLTWAYANPEVIDPPARAPWRGSPADAVQLTTFASWEELGAWYRGLQADRVRVTPALARQAQELTRGLTTDLDRVKAVYAFVATGIHYVGLSFGIGRFQPHDAGEVLANGYGDCKDKHTLLAGLLGALGIEAWPVLVRASGDIDPDVPSPAQFDHVISLVRLGDQRLWLDTTQEVSPFGFLTRNLRGRPALVIPRTGPAMLVSAPEPVPFPMGTETTFTGKVEPDGMITGHCVVSLRGDAELPLRQVFRQLPANRWPEFLTQTSVLPGLGYEFTAVQPGPSEETRLPFTISWDLKRSAPSDWNKGRMILPIPLTGLEQVVKAARRPTDPVFLPVANAFHATASLVLPAGRTPTLPPAVNLVNPAGEYHATYTVRSGAFEVDRRLVFRKDTVAPADRAAFNAFCDAIGNDEGRYLLLTGGEALDPEAARSFDQGCEALQRKDFSAAREAFRRTLDRSPRYPGAHGNCGLTYLAKGDAPTGLRELLKEEELNPELGITYQILANVLQSMGRKEEAVEQFQKGLVRDPDNQELLAGLVTLLHQEGRYRDAAACLEKAIARDAQNTANLIGLAEDYARTGRHDEMAAVLAKAIALDDTPEALLGAAELVLGGGRPSAPALAWTRQAETRLEAASVGQGDMPAKGVETTALLARAWTLHGRLSLLDHHPDQALPFLKAAWSLTLDGGCGASLAEAYAALGQIREAGRQYELAALAEGADQAAIGSSYRKLMGHALPAGRAARVRDRAPSPAEALAGLHIGHFPWTGAKAPAVAVMEASPAGIEAVHPLDSTGDAQASLPVLRQMKWAIAFPDAAPRRVFLKGTLEFRAGDGIFRFEGPRPPADRPGAKAALNDAFQAFNGNRLAEAQAKLDQARRLDPGFSAPYYLQGMIAIRSNDMKATKAAFMKYLELDGGGEKAGEIRALLRDPSLKNLR